MSMQWDEVSHFTGGLLLTRGQLWEYFLTSSFYPPIFNLITAAYFAVGGASVFVGRFVAVSFAALSTILVFQIARHMYNPKTAVLSAVLFSVMPGLIWVSRMAMIETMLIFIFLVAMLFFFRWLQTDNEKDRILSIVALALGVLVKYQMLVVAPIIMIAGMLLWKRNYLKTQIDRFTKPKFLIAGAVALAVGLAAAYALLASGLVDLLIHSIQIGTIERSLYSVRFPVPVFYFVEMVWPYSNMHPISPLLYVLGLLGLGLMAYRRQPQDKFLLLCFIVVYAVFTAVPNRQWRYVALLFPILAIAASNLLFSAYEKAQKTWKNTQVHLNRRWAAKLAATLLVVLTATGIFYSCSDAYSWVAQDQLQVPIEQASQYAAQNLNGNQSVVVVFPLNYLNEYMVWFYLNAHAPQENSVWQYPQLAVDSYTPALNTTEFIDLCQQRNVQYVFLYESGAFSYFNTTLTSGDVYTMLSNTDRFTSQATFGAEPHRIFVLTFT